MIIIHFKYTKNIYAYQVIPVDLSKIRQKNSVEIKYIFYYYITERFFKL
jgi:hypothetical protein